MLRRNQEAALIASATELFHRQGFGATGAREIAASVGVPQGSFTNHFRSKEALGVAALDEYVARLSETVRSTLSDRSRPAHERILSYFDEIGARLAEADWQRGCLIPDLATEAATHGDTLRARLVEVLAEQSAAFAAVVGEIVPDGHAGDVAAFILAAWHGTLLRAKAERSAEPFDRFRRTLRELIATWTVGHG